MKFYQIIFIFSYGLKRLEIGFIYFIYINFNFISETNAVQNKKEKWFELQENIILKQEKEIISQKPELMLAYFMANKNFISSII